MGTDVRGARSGTEGDRVPHPTDDRPPASEPDALRRLPRVRTLGRIVRIPLLAYLGVTVVLAGLQTRLIFPGAASQGRPEAQVHPGPGSELVTLAAPGGDRVVALFGSAQTATGRPHPEASRRPTILFFYGNGMCLAACSPVFEQFRRLGCNVLIPDYLGYGLSGGEPGEAGCRATADAAYEHLRGRRDVDPERLVVGGWSLGGAVAIDLAARRPVDGVFGFSTFTRLADVASAHVPFLPVSLLLRHRFDSQTQIGRIQVPILLGHGDQDEIVPLDLSRRLAAAAPTPPRSFVVRGASHNDFFDQGSAQIDAELTAFLQRLDADAPAEP